MNNSGCSRKESTMRHQLGRILQFWRTFVIILGILYVNTKDIGLICVIMLSTFRLLQSNTYDIEVIAPSPPTSRLLRNIRIVHMKFSLMLLQKLWLHFGRGRGKQLLGIKIKHLIGRTCSKIYWTGRCVIFYYPPHTEKKWNAILLIFDVIP